MIIDTNVVLGWFMAEQQSEEKDRLLTRGDLAAPDLIDVEVARVLTRRTRQSRLSASDARSIWADWSAMPVERAGSNGLLNDAFELSLRLRASLSDCVFLALAIEQGDVLITGDARFVRAVRVDRSLADFVRPLVPL